MLWRNSVIFLDLFFLGSTDIEKIIVKTGPTHIEFKCLFVVVFKKQTNEQIETVPKKMRLGNLKSIFRPKILFCKSYPIVRIFKHMKIHTLENKWLKLLQKPGNFLQNKISGQKLTFHSPVLFFGRVLPKHLSAMWHAITDAMIIPWKKCIHSNITV